MWSLISIILLIRGVMINNDAYLITSGIFAMAGAIADHITINLNGGNDDDEV